MTDAALTALTSGGAVAVLAAFALVVVWVKLQRLTVYYEGDPSDPEKSPGKISRDAAAAQAREDSIRSEAALALAAEREAGAKALAAERAENKALWREINDTLKSFSGEA